MLSKLIINLERRPERLSHHNLAIDQKTQVVKAVDGSTLSYEDIQSANIRPNWRDPFRNRRMTKGEYACFLSHMQCWELAANSLEPTLILEDDAVYTEKYNDEALSKKISDPATDLILLGYNENIPSGVVYHGDGFVTPAFPYNAHAYVVKPETARKLLNLTRRKDFTIIPVDDWFSEKLSEGLLSVVACEESMANQIPRAPGKHDIEPEESPYMNNFTVNVLTCATEAEKAFRLYTSATAHGITLVNLGKGVNWRGTDMSGPGGGQKVNLIKEHISALPDTDVVMFVDGYDVFFTDNLTEIIDRWLGFNTRILFGAEKTCWPNESIANRFPEQPTAYKYLNSGTFIAEVGELKKFLEGIIEDHEDDQLFMQEKFLSGQYDVQLDSEQYIFQTYDENVTKVRHQIYNSETLCYGCLFHGNGGDSAKAKLDSLYSAFFGRQVGLVPTTEHKIIDTDMLEVKFATEEWCNYLIEIAEKHGGWEPLPDDLFPAQEIRVKELGHGVYEELEAHWNQYIVPIVEKYWHPIKMYGIRDAFVMKYTPETQNKLALHHDASLVTGSIKLNEAYEGGELVYPRQLKSNKNTAIGDCILFPGQVTHGHQCLEVTKGTKYSLTIWTSRYQGDVL